MAATFNSPPGWPTPPEGWTPPPGWAPDPSWPPAPAGWQFWTDDGILDPALPNAVDPNATQSIGTQQTQVLPSAGGPGLYAYGPSAGLEQPGASPYGTPGQGPGGGYPGAPQPHGPYSAAGAPPPKQRNTAAIIAVCVVAALVLGGLIWGVTSLLSGGDDPDPTVAPTTTAEPTATEEPTDPATTDEPTDPATTDEPTDPATDPATGDDGVIELTGDQPAIAVGSSGAAIAELRLAEIVPNWQPASGSVLCSDPENGQHLGLRFDITTLPALADEDPPTYTFLGWEIGAEIDGAALEANGFATGLFCLDSDDRAPTDMGPDETASGWVLLDVPTSVTAVTFDNLFDFTGQGNSYRWVLADQ